MQQSALALVLSLVTVCASADEGPGGGARDGGRPERNKKIDLSEAMKEGDTPHKCVEPDARSGHRFKAGCKEMMTRRGHTAEMAYNALGLRDKDYDPKPKPGVKRVLLVGASRLAAPGLAEKDTPARKLEAILRAGKSKGKVEVINAGVEGYSPLLQAARIREWVKAYSPTHVLLQIELGNAMATDLLYTPYLEAAADGTKTVNLRVLPWMKPWAWVRGAAKDYQVMRKMYTWPSGFYRAVKNIRCKMMSELMAATKCLGEPTLDAISRMRAEAEGGGAKFAVSFASGPFPNRLHVSPAFDMRILLALNRVTPVRFMEGADVYSLLRDRGVEAILLSPIEDEELLLPGDYHFNEKGSAYFARHLAERAREFLAR